ncbi:class I SAM-dependent methyltransferase [Priestia taiwanensis]|uniref:Methyltransferase n=1 Tax=Priestia taiwanensis TaxID=1347902 RepID=A0A917AYH6_9BACI|nr:class I SAM-dependent methyltransferase [Priestia taiwanensis]MBM7365249.1 SAM-dependent methyltransferase [Priestia taiwanensis]GGE85346.1 methyltransferase [Priestia taiwanensis]
MEETIRKEVIRTEEDVWKMLDSFLREPVPFWDEFYSNREKKIPFFEQKPDENLVAHFTEGRWKSGRVLELGCGPGRNAIYFAEQGCIVDAVDLSQEALTWAAERAKEQNVDVTFLHRNLFELDIEEGIYDIVYDSGCFHHIAPHRRMSYLRVLQKALKRGGYFALTCFAEDGPLGGATISDWDVYRLQSLQGGLGFTEEKLRVIFDMFEVVEIRPMKVLQSDEVFGVDGLWTALFQVK